MEKLRQASKLLKRKCNSKAVTQPGVAQHLTRNMVMQWRAGY
uniref:Uncharacterized protein n=1 Tax=Arundo donax TaxID=35708 RepID=A0A0A9E4X2_ARUDO